MIRRLVLVTVCLSACASAQMNDASDYRDRIMAKTDTKMFDCICPSIDQVSGEPIEPYGPQHIGEGDIADKYPSKLMELMTSEYVYDADIESYAKTLGKNTKIDKYNTINCWSGSCGGPEYVVSNTDDVRILRVFVSTQPPAYAHQCTFAENPKLLTTKECPKYDANLFNQDGG